MKSNLTWQLFIGGGIDWKFISQIFVEYLLCARYGIEPDAGEKSRLVKDPVLKGPTFLVFYFLIVYFIDKESEGCTCSWQNAKLRTGWILLGIYE